MGTKCPMSFNLSCLIKPHNSHHLFTLSCATTSHPLVPPSHPNHKLPINSPSQFNKLYTTYQFPLLAPTHCVNVGSQPHTFPNHLNHAQVKRFPPFTLLTPIVAHNQTPQPTFTSSTHCNLHLKSFAPLVSVNLPLKISSSSTFLSSIQFIQSKPL